MAEEAEAQSNVFIKQVYRVSPAKIGFLRFLLESYDGLGFVRTLDSRQALVEIAYPPSRRRDAAALLAALAAELEMVAVPVPPSEFFPPL